MKLMIVLSVVFSLSCFANQEPMPNTQGNGYTNQNQRAEYHYEKAPNEVIWTEFGRPYWKQASGKKMAEMKKPMAKNVMADDDRDGVMNKYDKCPKTSANTLVNKYGCKLKKNQKLKLDVKFASGKADLNGPSKAKLDALAQVMKADKDLKLEVQGHTDSTGKRSYNVFISDKRAKQVMAYLTGHHGISTSRLSAKGYGPDMPVQSNDTRAGRQANRRVEVKVQ